MFQKARETAYQDSESLLLLVIRWRKPLIISVLLSAIGAFVFSGPTFITPKFKSSVVFFPSSTNSISKALLDPSGSEKQDILAFGAEEQAEQMLQILNSDDIRDQIISKYNLLNHYHIPADDPFPLTRLNEQFRDNILFSRTEFMSVRIDVLDEDPVIAASIANDITALLDTMKTKIQGTRANEALAIIQNTYAEKKNSIKLKEDSLQKIRRLGIMDYKSQSQIVNNEYMSAVAIFANEKASLKVLEQYKPENDTSVIATKARINGAAARIKELNKQLQLLATYGGASVALNEDLTTEREDLSKLKQQYDKLLIDANANLTHKFLVNKAMKGEKKVYPVRWLIVLVTVVITFVLSLVVILTLVRYRELKYKI